jgi:hypothetical protein
MTTGGNSISGSGLVGKPLQMDAAHIAAIKRSVFARPTNTMAPVAQTGQAIHGAQGAPHGMPNGFIGAAVPQMGAAKAPGAAPAPRPAQSAPQGPQAPHSPAMGAGGGLAHLMPLLQIIGPLLMHLFGGGGGLPGAGTAASTPRGGGLI